MALSGKNLRIQKDNKDLRYLHILQRIGCSRIRLNILNQYVDYFVLVEATKTFSGQPKPLHFKENKERFKKWEHKIIYYAVTDAPKMKENYERDLRKKTFLCSTKKS